MELFSGKYRHKRTVLPTFLKVDNTVAESIKGVISAHSDILARVVHRAALTDDDIAGNAFLSTKNLDT